MDRIEASLEYQDGHWVYPEEYRRQSYRAERLLGQAVSKVRKVAANQTMYERHIGPVPDGYQVRRTCDEPQCCRPEHLTLKLFRLSHDEAQAELRQAVLRKRAELMSHSEQEKQEKQEEPRVKIPFDASASDGLKIW